MIRSAMKASLLSLSFAPRLSMEFKEIEWLCWIDTFEKWSLSVSLLLPLRCSTYSAVRMIAQYCTVRFVVLYISWLSMTGSENTCNYFYLLFFQMIGVPGLKVDLTKPFTLEYWREDKLHYKYCQIRGKNRIGTYRKLLFSRNDWNSTDQCK